MVSCVVLHVLNHRAQGDLKWVSFLWPFLSMIYLLWKAIESMFEPVMMYGSYSRISRLTGDVQWPAWTPFNTALGKYPSLFPVSFLLTQPKALSLDRSLYWAFGQIKRLSLWGSTKTLPNDLIRVARENGGLMESKPEPFALLYMCPHLQLRAGMPSYRSWTPLVCETPSYYELLGLLLHTCFVSPVFSVITRDMNF